jgi:hypothetical protein
MQAVMAMHLGRDWGSDAGSDGNVMATQSGSVDVEDAAGAVRGGGALKRQRRASGASQLGQQTDGLHQREASGEATAAAAPAASGDEGTAGLPRFELTPSVAASVEEVEERGRQVDEAVSWGGHARGAGGWHAGQQASCGRRAWHARVPPRGARNGRVARACMQRACHAAPAACGRACAHAMPQQSACLAKPMPCTPNLPPHALWQLNALEGLVLQQLDALKQAWQENIQGCVRALRRGQRCMHARTNSAGGLGAGRLSGVWPRCRPERMLSTPGVSVLLTQPFPYARARHAGSPGSRRSSRTTRPTPRPASHSCLTRRRSKPRGARC